MITERQAEYLAAIYGGLSDRQIAVQLYVSVNTVRGIVYKLYKKIGVHNRTGAAVWYYRHYIAEVSK